jgi:hypothetical protein
METGLGLELKGNKETAKDTSKTGSEIQEEDVDTLQSETKKEKDKSRKRKDTNLENCLGKR